MPDVYRERAKRSHQKQTNRENPCVHPRGSPVRKKDTDQEKEETDEVSKLLDRHCAGRLAGSQTYTMANKISAIISQEREGALKKTRLFFTRRIPKRDISRFSERPFDNE